MTKTEVSYTYTILILGGFLLAVAGAVTALLGLGPVSETVVEWDKIKITTSSIGLAVMAGGGALALIAAVNKPSDVRVLGGEHKSATDRASGPAARIAALLLLVLGVIGLVVQLALSGGA
ncbi:hypothetical protein WCD74_01330 [Actinomycetospora sp. OC33-EN08]|uniref:Integral membrane protein n=1 Tax=Actinomycetospora aurantiaca TaxID=3129233 RepID=A0ABU8MGE2_9PSEU